MAVVSDDGPIRLTWRFESLDTGRLPFHFLRCQLSTCGIVAIGQGYHFFMKSAMCQSMAEAWERLWLLLPSQAGSGHSATSSNGFAAGRTVSSAVSASRGELIERAIFLSAWRSMRGWDPHVLSSIGGRMLASWLVSRGWCVRAYRLRDRNLGSILAVLIQHPKYGAIFDTVYLGEVQLHRSKEAKVLRSLVRGAAARHGGLSFAEPTDFPDTGSPQDQARYYALPGAAKAFSFLDDPQSAEGATELPEPEGIATTVLCSVAALPAVAVSQHAKWPVLSWGKTSIEGANPWPHPLA